MSDPEIPTKKSHAKLPLKKLARKLDLVQAYALRTEKGLTYQQIADVLGASEAGVYQGLKRLHALLGEPNQLKALESQRTSITSEPSISSALKPAQIPLTIARLPFCTSPASLL